MGLYRKAWFEFDFNQGKERDIVHLILSHIINNGRKTVTGMSGPTVRPGPPGLPMKGARLLIKRGLQPPTIIRLQVAVIVAPLGAFLDVFLVAA